MTSRDYRFWWGLLDIVLNEAIEGDPGFLKRLSPQLDSEELTEVRYLAKKDADE